MKDLSKLAEDLWLDSTALLEEYLELFREHGIPTAGLEEDSPPTGEPFARRIMMVSTHGYWGDPPPAGVPDTGGQTYYVLKVSKAWAKQGRQAIILARHFEDFPRVEKFADGVWLVRIRARGNEFVRKEEIYQLAPLLAEAGIAVAALFGADAMMGHYADGMVVAAEMAERMRTPLVCVPHSMGVLKMTRLGMDPNSQADLRDEQYHFGTRESFELAALRAANFEIANTPREPEILTERYGVSWPCAVMPAGAALPFFEAAEKPVDQAVLDRFGLTEGRYMLFWGRLSEAKNVDGVVRVLGEARRLAPDVAGDVKAVIIGGSPDNPSDEERTVEEAVQRELVSYGLDESDVLRVESQNHDVLAPLARGGLAYVGMQHLEPFGMGAAEAMGAGIPVLISSAAGMTRWLEDGTHALFVDPKDARGAAEKLVGLLRDENAWQRLAEQGRKKATEDFSWPGIAAKQGGIFDRLLAGKDPREEAGAKADDDRFARRTGRAYHRMCVAWRGDMPHIKPHHVSAAEMLLPHVTKRIRDAAARGERLTIAISGESGSGKTEIAHLLCMMMRGDGLNGLVISGDAFFIRAPAENHDNRVAAHARGHLEEAIGPQEVNLERLDRIVAEARSRDVHEVMSPSDCRTIPGRRYLDVPVPLDGVDAVFVDLTYALMLENATCKIFLQRSSLANLAHVEERNRARDPDQDFGFIRSVLELEHSIIAPLQERADLVVDADYELVE